MSQIKKPQPIVTLPADDEVIVSGSFLPPEVEAPAESKPAREAETHDEDEGDDEVPREECDDDACQMDAEQCVTDTPAKAEILDWQDRAKGAKYRKTGKLKRTRYPRVNLSRREVYIVIHQTAFEWKPSNPLWPSVTAHYVITSDATAAQLHPHNCKLVASNWADVRPAHSINIEVGGNFEAFDGSGKWYKPHRFGRGRASDHQLDALAHVLEHLKERARIEGWKIKGVIPHWSATPGKPACPGERVWKHAERTAIRLKLPIPGDRPVFRRAGTVIDPQWRSQGYQRGEGVRI